MIAGAGSTAANAGQAAGGSAGTPAGAGGSPGVPTSLGGSAGSDGASAPAAGGTIEGGGGGATAGANGSAAGSGGAGASGAGRGGEAGASSAGAGGAENGGGSSSTAGSAGSSVAGTGGMGSPLPEPTCSQIIGLTLTREWYEAGFELGVNAGRWQLKAAQSAYVEEWAKADSPFWQTQLVSPCAAGSINPDRVVFVILSWEVLDTATWQNYISASVTNMQAKYAGLKRVDLMTIIRGPGNMACGDPAVYKESTHVPAALDEAIARVAANSEIVRVGPQTAVDACSDFADVGPHLTAAGNKKLAAKIAAAFGTSVQ